MACFFPLLTNLKYKSSYGFFFQLGAASRLQGITPAAVVHLLNYVRQTGQKERRAKREQSHQKEDSEEEPGAREASLTQWNKQL